MDFIKFLAIIVFLACTADCQTRLRSRIEVWGTWVATEPCSVSCDGDGYQTRSRNCSTGNRPDCEAVGGHWWEVIKCNEGPCVFGWTEWAVASACSTSCGGPGYLEKKRNCTSGRVNDCQQQGGTYWSVVTCDNGPCAAWTEWAAWGECSKSCGVGVKSSLRNCTSGNNDDCKKASGENYYRLTVCIQPSCVSTTTPAVTTTTTTTTAVPAVWAEWYSFIRCSKTCGAGFGERKRSCSTGLPEDCQRSSGEKEWDVYACNLGSCTVDGSWGLWASWTACPVTCGSAQVTRSRSCIFPKPDSKGNDCVGSARETQACDQGPCPVDGSWGDWTAYSACSATCDEGQSSRSRTCKFLAGVPHGSDCPGAATETQSCNLELCKSDGMWADWSSYSKCTKTCGDGISFRARICLFDPSRPKGADCTGPELDRSKCNMGTCAVDGKWSHWASWSQCTHTCNGGRQTRSRVCTFDPNAPHGADCVGDANESQDCGLTECPVDGIWGAWAPWVTCTATCGTGRTTRTRTCQFRSINPNTPHGRPCTGEGNQQKTCNDHLCPVDAFWSTWSRFGSCNVTCGGGLRTKTRTCVYDPVAPMGRNCTGLDSFSEECNANDCPVDGQLSDWKEWSACPVSCDGGSHSRSRNCAFPLNKPHGKDCVGSLAETEKCNESPCPTTTTTTTTPIPTVPGHWSSWTAWDKCTLTCGTGTQTRTRSCLYSDPAHHGDKCKGHTKENQDCNTNHCPVDGYWGTWGAFSRCSATCGNGTHSRTRQCEFDVRYDHGEDCTGTDNDSGICNAGLCPVDGVWTDWGSWNSCPVTCGGSIKERTRNCFFPKNAPQGADCGTFSHENATCGTDDCPVDGVLTNWSDWSNCTEDCGGGTQERSRDCNFEAGKPHGLDCHGDLYQNATCNTDLCPVDGVWSSWAEWNACDVSCDGGRRSRGRTCDFDQHAPHGADCVGVTTETEQCNTDPCPVDGNWNSWDSWATCSVSCANGTHSRTRACHFVPDVPHGANCSGPAIDTEGCSDGLCPVDGTWSSWNEWSMCTVTCGNGTSTRNRSCDFPDGVPHGFDCAGNSDETVECNTNLCPVDGFFSEWSNWTGCDLTCGGGHMSRTRHCVFPQDVPHGEGCIGLFNDSMTCNPENCPVDGFWSAWSNMTACSLSCGGGSQFRTRQCEFQADSPHGNNCSGLASETQQCNTQLCAVDGQLSEWGNWTVCSVSCEGGTQTRTRTCDFQPDPIPHGADCTDPLQETRDCNVEKCPINGKWSAWSPYGSCSLSCEGGIQFRNRTCVFDIVAPHGSGCFGDDVKNRTCNEQPCPVDGTWGDWNAWHECSVSCGGGKMVRDRTCTFPDGIDHGQDCVGTNSDIADCGMELCPVDGYFSEWISWTACSASCGDGQQFRNRKCQFRSGVPHGANCTGMYSDSQACNNGTCPVDGQWTAWSVFTTCSVTCDGGTQTRDRTCKFDDVAPHGTDCPGNATETQACGTDECPVDGQWTTWSTFTPCSDTCGNGTSTRNRTCEYLPAGKPHGDPCLGPDTEADACNPTPCPVDAELSAWSEWTTCNASCGGGIQSRDRTCTWPTPQHGADCTGPLSETKSCNDNLCPVDGNWGEWGNWSECSVTCNIGQSARTRNCTYDAVAPPGAPCPGSDHQTQFCKKDFCPVDGKWTSWTAYGVCSTTCGDGIVTRTRNCAYAIPLAPHGKDCEGSNNETMPCTNTTECPVDGVWSTWSEWAACSTTCGHGDQLRTRTCTFDPVKPRGFDCSGLANETKQCQSRDCPVDGVWRSWSSWSLCSETCGGGTHTRRRECYFQPRVPQGAYCPGRGAARENCNEDPCPVDGTFSDWTEWTKCPVTCGGGTQTRDRTCVFPDGAPHGHNCSGQLQESQDCHTNSCPVDGHFTHWSQWTTCDVTCGGGTQARNRTCIYPPGSVHGHLCVGPTDDTQPCNDNLCPVDGTLSPWSEWSNCPVTCGGGTQTRDRTCDFSDGFPHGIDCAGPLHDSQDCNTNGCPVDGHFTHWSKWTTCGVTCGGGSQSRNRTCIYPPGSVHGHLCVGSTDETQACNENLCPVDGTLSPWSEWSSCPVTCGGGTQTRDRTCDFPDGVPHGNDCAGPLQDSQDCNTNGCPIDGHFTHWSKWTTCDVTCGGGSQSRNRTCIYPPDSVHGHLCVGPTDDTQACNDNPCPVDGTLSPWSEWSNCPVTCGGGTQTRDRTCDFPDGVPHGNECAGPLHETQDCSTNGCPIDGHFTHWSKWTTCDVTCGSGTQARNRTCIYPPGSVHGHLCVGPTDDTQACSENICPVDGTLSAWGEWSRCTVTCGGGTQSRDRTCDFPDGVPHGNNCTESLNESQDCSTNGCPVDGHFTHWSQWTTCDVTCGGGTQARNRTCIYPPGSVHGHLCVGPTDDTQACSENICPVDGTLSAWGEWSSCTVTCGGGTQSRDRTCDFPDGVPHGNDCAESLHESQDCSTNGCPVDGHFTHWSKWTTCDVTCGGGTQARNRTCIYPPGSVHGHLCVGPTDDTQACNDNLCPVDGTLSAWGEWSSCTVTCGGGTQSRDRACDFPDGVPHGNDCAESLHESQDCSTNGCPIDGHFTHWSQWTTCDVTCGGGTQARNRTCIYPPGSVHGHLCVGPTDESQDCNTNDCAVDGVWDQWGDWSACGVTCGDGNQTRVRTCFFPPQSLHGLDCVGDSSEDRVCSLKACPVDGVWSTWTAWTTCSVTCGGGTQTRDRTCTFAPGVPKGSDCVGNSSEPQNCGASACPTTTTLPPTKRHCFVCDGPEEVCEDLYYSEECPDFNQQYCINEITNDNEANRYVNRRCGTLEECHNGWFQKYSSSDKCINFDQNYISTSDFYCEYCCSSDDCNELINMPQKYHPSDG